MRKEIFVNGENLEIRVAVREDGRLVELYVERLLHGGVVGNIYRGRVQNVLPGMQAAFVDIGLERNAFLYVDDVLPQGGRDVEEEEEEEGEDLEGITSEMGEAQTETRNSYGKKGGVSIESLLRRGQEITVQVKKEPIGTKGARVVTELSIPGRYLVLVPGGNHVGVSRRIENEAERERLRAIAERLRPRGHGLIVRTVAEGQGEEMLRQDVTFLQRVWQKIRRKEKQSKAPALLYKDHDLLYRLLRDQVTEEVETILIDREELYNQARETLKTLSPQLRERVKLYPGPEPLFTAYGLEDELEKALRRRVWLDCGGYLVIDHTEALTVIDVNTGKFVGSTDLATTVRTTNLEAAAEIARQLRLRNVTGIIIVDFIDMETPADRELILAKLAAELEKDRTKTNILGFTNLGLVQLTRKKVYEVLTDILQRPCPYCEGTGRVFSEETMAIKVERYLREFFRTSPGIEAILLGVHPWVAAVFIGAGGVNLSRLEEELGKVIFVRGFDALHIEELRIMQAGTKEEVEQHALPVSPGQILSVKIEGTHVANPADGIARLEGYVLDVEGAGREVGKTLKVEITKVLRTYARAKVIREERLN